MAHANADSLVHHQYEDIDQQRETYIVGMWAFLVTEIMFFGALFVIYMYYRSRYQAAWYEAHQFLDWRIGGTNTAILLISSFFMAMAVYNHQQNNRKMVQVYLAGVQVCALAFLVLKIALEWVPKAQHNMVPWGHEFIYHGKQGSSEVGHLFFNLYFGMTGLHALHILVGMILIGCIQVMMARNNKHFRDYIHTEMIGLYWHFVDIVWIFLFPLFYLMPK